VTIKSLIFVLFLCLCLIWAVAVYEHLNSGQEIVNHGLLWTILLLAGALLIVLSSRVVSWIRIWRAKASQRPVASAKPAAAVHEDDAALAALIAEANATLAKAPNYVAVSGRLPLSQFRLYLLIGPESAGKTGTFLNSGVEARLLAGQPGGSATRLCNLWLAKNAVFAEFSGRVFGADSERWRSLLRILRGTRPASFWHSLWRDPEPGMQLSGVVGFTDVRELTSSSADPQRFERGNRDWQERLRTIGLVFGADFPVYQVFTKCDKLPFFTDYFGRLPESEVNQILGCSLPLRKPAASPGEAYTEAEAKRLVDAFRPLYQSLAERRLSCLAHEPNPARKPGIYEFPRELKRIRQPLVQFLIDVFKPNQLQSTPILRGFYLTGIQEVEAAGAKTTGEDGDWSIAPTSLEATHLFRNGDATQIFKQGESGPVRGRTGLKTRWIFASDLFHQIVLADLLPVQPALPADSRLAQYRRGLLGATCGACVLLCLAFVNSWANNRSLLNDVAEAAGAVSQKPVDLASLPDLRSLENLRQQVERLQNGAGLSYRWGLYTGNSIRDGATKAYFARFQQSLLVPLNEVMLNRLKGLPVSPSATDSYEPAYGYLKTHLMISAGACKPDPAFVSHTLKQARAQLPPDAGPGWQDLANRQTDFYIAALAGGNPCPLKEDAEARDRARRYLEGIKGIEPMYRRILAEADKAVQKPQQLADLAPNYKVVLSSKAEISPAFSVPGWQYVQDASKKTGSGSAADSCVLGRGLSLPGLVSDDTAAAIQARFISDYVKQWRDYVAGFSVLPYGNAADAAKKLAILADHKSPLLALFALVSNQTNFATTAENGLIDKVKDGVKGFVGQGKKKVDQLTGSPDVPRPATVQDITQTFQPVQYVVPPNAPTWVIEKNAAYMAALAQLGQSIQAIADNNKDPALYQAEHASYDKAMEAAKQIEAGLRPTGVVGLDVEVQRLLEEPIVRTGTLPRQMDPAAGVNKALTELCNNVKGTLHKFPFQSKSREEATLGELSAFAPTGAIWKFATGPAAGFVVKDAGQWKPKDPSANPQVAPELIAFLNKAQLIEKGFFSLNPDRPGFTYNVRPALSADYADAKLEFELDGTTYLWEDHLQKTLSWPGPQGAELKSVARIIGGKVALQFDIRTGPWSIFRIMADAEPRTPNSKVVEWRYSIGAGDSKDPIPPVRIELVQFSGETDVFNLSLYQGLSCPNKAVQ
jgi:type VI secretion system protein ImpL